METEAPDNSGVTQFNLTSKNGLKVRGIEGGVEVIEVGSSQLSVKDVIVGVGHIPLDKCNSSEAENTFKFFAEKDLKIAGTVALTLDKKQTTTIKISQMNDILACQRDLDEIGNKYDIAFNIYQGYVTTYGRHCRFTGAWKEIADVLGKHGSETRIFSRKRAIPTPMQADSTARPTMENASCSKTAPLSMNAPISCRAESLPQLMKAPPATIAAVSSNAESSAKRVKAPPTTTDPLSTAEFPPQIVKAPPTAIAPSSNAGSSPQPVKAPPASTAAASSNAESLPQPVKAPPATTAAAASSNTESFAKRARAPLATTAPSSSAELPPKPVKAPPATNIAAAASSNVESSAKRVRAPTIAPATSKAGNSRIKVPPSSAPAAEASTASVKAPPRGVVTTQFSQESGRRECDAKSSGGKNKATSSGKQNARSGRRTSVLSRSSSVTAVDATTKERKATAIKADVDAWAARRARLQPLSGTIVRTVPDKEFGFIRPDIRRTKKDANDEDKNPAGVSSQREKEEEDVYFHFEKVRRSGGLALEPRDTVTYVLDMRKNKHDRFPAKQVKVCALKSRPRAVLVAHLEKQLEQLSGGNRFDHSVGKTLKTCGGDQLPFWHLCASTLASEDLHLLFKLPVALARIGGGTHALKAVIESPIYDPANPVATLLITRLVHGFVEHDTFAREIARRLPTHLQYFVPILQAVIDHKQLLVVDPRSTNELLMTLFRAAALTSAGLRQEDAALHDWRTLPMVPTVSELLERENALPSVLQRVALPTVVEKGPYQSASDYLNTYIRLLREDCFDALKKGVRQFMKDSLDQRDMRTYTARLAGLHVLDREGLGLDLQITPHKVIKDFKKSEALMFGNLLCISTDHRFTKPCWATVLERDAELLNTNKLVTVELVTVDNSTLHLVDVVKMLVEAEDFLVCESPTYYRAYQPVLESLQGMDPEQGVPFQSEFVHVSREATAPAYLTHTTSLDFSTILDKDSSIHPPVRPGTRRAMDQLFGCMPDADCSGVDGANNVTGNTVAALLRLLNEPNAGARTSLDNFQLEAVKHVLTHRVSIVQGGPGCGKSTLGIRLLRLLLTASENVRALVVTYKNHALDELLEGCFRHWPNKIARMGGRSTNETLNMRSLNVLRREHVGVTELHEIRDLDRGMKDLLPRLEIAAKCFAAASEFTPGCFWRRAPEALESLLLGPWFGAGNARQALQYAQRKKWDLPRCLATGTKQFDDALRGFVDAALQEWLPPKRAALHIAALQRVVISTDNDDDDDLEEAEDVEHCEFERLAGRTKKDRDFLSKMIELKRNENTIKASPSMVAEIGAGQEMYLRSRDMWQMSVDERAYFVQLLVRDEMQEAESEFIRTLEEWEEMAAERHRLDELLSVSVLKKQKIVGATSTGVCLHQNLLKLLRPTIVCIEEAAELLEPQVLACLGPWVEHLILIGDHWQLPPSVNSFTLKKDKHFGLSMMERLIINDLEYGKLMKQSRMRPETSNLLRSRYPNLEDNLSVVCALPIIECVATNVFWWEHDFEETQGRSPSNPKEAERVVRLALYLVLQGEHPSKITILSPYMGQVAVLRKELRKILPPHLEHLGLTEKEGEAKVFIDIMPADRFQGSENEIILISMVRCNREYRKGFLETDEGLNRRVVLQSRNRRGLYIVGSRKTFESNKTKKGILETSKVYGGFIRDLERAGFIGDTLTLKCPRHPEATLKVRGAGDLPDQLEKTVCNQPCGHQMDCGLHTCRMRCHHLWVGGEASHVKNNCAQDVHFVCSLGHPLKRRCNEKEAWVLCVAKVIFHCPNGHQLTRDCHEDEGKIVCRAVKPHTCSHCTNLHTYDVPCGSSTTAADKLCQAPCSRTLSCSHPCSQRCGEKCSASLCRVEVDFVCQARRHPCKRLCCQDVNAFKCGTRVDFDCKKGGHPMHRFCYENEAAKVCNYACTKILPCDHVCQDRCSDPCPEFPSQCKECREIRKLDEKRAREVQRQQQEEARAAAKKELEDLANKKDVQTKLSISRSHPRFSEISILVKRLSIGQGMEIKVEDIEELTDSNVYKAQLRSKAEMIDPACPMERMIFWCRGRSKESILRSGFKLMRSEFGLCVEFCAKEVDESGYVIICDVLVGKKWAIDRDHRDVWKLSSETLKSIKTRGYDALLAPGNGQNSELIAIYDQKRVYSRYLVRYTKIGRHADLGPPSYWTMGTESEWKLARVTKEEEAALRLCLIHEGTLGGRDQREKGSHNSFHLGCAWRLEHPGLWAKYAAELHNLKTIEFPDLRTHKIPILKVKLRTKFYDAYKALPQALDTDVNEVMLLHGTKPDTVLKILSGGMNERFSGGIFGNGIYFAEDVAKNDQYVTVDTRFNDTSDLHVKLFEKTKMKHPGMIFYVFLCRVQLGVPQITRRGCSGVRELEPIPAQCVHVHHSLLAEIGDAIVRYREFIQFHGSRVYPEYLIAYQRK